MKPRKSNGGFTLIELLIVVAIIGILAVIAIPNLLNAMQRAKQKRTMTDMREIAQSWERRQVDFSSYRAAGAPGDLSAPSIDFADLEMQLLPTYTRSLPSKDGWGNPFQFGSDSSSYWIRSAGKDGTFTPPPYTPGGTTRFDCDIVFSDGSFLVLPEGMQAGN